ncbi:MAG: phospholipid transport system substrate-binding protein [Saprospiraceae bacterium]|jgi:phospholipid transport system substrate-binding protein
MILSMKKIGLLMAKALVGLSLVLSAQTFSQNLPEDALRISIDELISEFGQNRVELAADKQKLYAMAESVVYKNWDFSKMARLVLGKNWKKATEQQQTEFTEAFKDLLIRTYSSAMFKYTGKENIIFVGTKYKGDKKARAIVTAKGDLGDGSDPLTLTFSVYKDDLEAWRIYNIGVAGISLVTTYRTSYNQIIRTKGLDSLIESIEAKANG